MLNYLDEHKVGTVRIDITPEETSVWVLIRREQYPLLTSIELSARHEMTIKSVSRDESWFPDTQYKLPKELDQ